MSQQTFKDWAGHDIPYRLRAAREADLVDSSEMLICEIDPHNVDQWTIMGRGGSTGTALRNAIGAWNVYDQAE